jgi:hypothetical protein
MLKAKTAMTANPKQYFRKQEAGISYTSIPWDVLAIRGTGYGTDCFIPMHAEGHRTQRELLRVLCMKVLTLSRHMAFLSRNTDLAAIKAKGNVASFLLQTLSGH